MAPEIKNIRPKLHLTMPENHSQTNFSLLRSPDISTQLAQNLNALDVVDCLRQHDLLSDIESDEILGTRLHSASIQLLLQRINDQSQPGCIPIFVKCLQCCGYAHTAKLINDYLDNLYKFNECTDRTIGMKCGLVPQRPAIFVDRDIIYKLKGELIQACETSTEKRQHKLVPTKWVLVHGMPGNGKTYLTAAAVRSPELWSTCFPSGVFWLDIGKPGGEKLMIKLGGLLQMLEPPTGTPVAAKDMDSAIARLAQLFSMHKPDSAIVLDDVWDESVIKCFARLPCKCIIVTSRKSNITDSVSVRVSKISVEQGFTAEESMKFLSQILKKSEEDLPKEAREIHQRSTGSPMLIALIGGFLKENPHRFGYYLNKLKDLAQFDQIDSAIGLSVHELRDDLKEKFFDFAVFDDDVPIPAMVLGVLWNIDIIEEVEDMMALFVNSSLVTKEICLRDEKMFTLYRFHDLILHYARAHVPEHALEDKHRKLYNKYYAKCKGRMEDLQDDYYFHAFVGYHMSQGKLSYQMGELYPNEEFMEKRLKFCGPEVVLVDLILLRKQHRFLAETLGALEEKIKLRFAELNTITSPQIDPTRRRLSAMYSSTSDLSSRSHRNSWVNSDSSNPTSPEREPDHRQRSSSGENPTIHEVHSEPVIQSNGDIHISSRFTPHGSLTGNGHLTREISAPAVVQQVSMTSLRNDIFEDY